MYVGGYFCICRLSYSVAGRGVVNANLQAAIAELGLPKGGKSQNRWPHPCPSFPWSFRKYQGKPQKHQGFFSPCEPLKTLENKEKTLKKTKEFRSKKNTKETKTPRKRRTGQGLHLGTPRPATETRDGPTWTFHEKYRKKTPRLEILDSQNLPPKIPRNPKYRKRPFFNPEGPARHLDASRQKLTPHCLAAIFDSQLPSPKLSLKMPPKLPLPHNRGHFSSFKIAPVVRVRF